MTLTSESYIIDFPGFHAFELKLKLYLFLMVRMRLGVFGKNTTEISF